MAIDLRTAPQDLKRGFDNTVWNVDPATVPPWKRWLVHALRISVAIGRDLANGQLNLQAMSLVYTTLLSLVPMLAISFSVLKGFGVHNQLEPVLLNLMAPLGEKGVEITTRIIEFVDNAKVGVLGSVGLGLLVYTVVTLMQKIERAFNFSWHVTQHRSFAKRFSDYLSVILIGPVLIFASVGLSASLQAAPVVERLAAIEPLGTLFNIVGTIVPYLLLVAAFTFIYVFVPNTKVKVKSAFVGALVAGFMWKMLGWAFAAFVVTSTNYAAIYSAFATLIIFMIWLYAGWLVLLLGASVACYHQKPELVTSRGDVVRPANRYREQLALLILHLIGQHHYRGQAPWTSEHLAQRLNAPIETVDEVLVALVEHGLLTRTDADPPELVPGRPFEDTNLKVALDAVRLTDPSASGAPPKLSPEAGVDGLMSELDAAWEGAIGARTLKDLALDSVAAPPTPAAATARAASGD